MLIRVMYKNHKFDMVSHNLLDHLINDGKIRKFQRSDGWAVIGKNRIRGTGGLYEGPDRRQTTPAHVI
jgi:hypothetical protein